MSICLKELCSQILGRIFIAVLLCHWLILYLLRPQVYFTGKKKVIVIMASKPKFMENLLLSQTNPFLEDCLKASSEVLVAHQFGGLRKNFSIPS